MWWISDISDRELYKPRISQWLPPPEGMYLGDILTYRNCC